MAGPAENGFDWLGYLVLSAFIKRVDGFSDAVVDDDEGRKRIGPPPAKEGSRYFFGRNIR